MNGEEARPTESLQELASLRDQERTDGAFAAYGGSDGSGSPATLVGLGLVALAILTSVLPGVYGIGFVWSVAMLVGGALVAWRELRAGTGRARFWPPFYALLVAVMAFQQLRLSLMTVLWLVAAVLIGVDRYRKDVAGPGGSFDLRGAWSGPGRFALVGVAVCLASLFLTWGTLGSSGFFDSTGYFSSTYTPAEYGQSFDVQSGNYEWGQTQPGQWGTQYNPGLSNSLLLAGIEYDGRSVLLAPFAVFALIGLALWATYRGSAGGAPVASRLPPLALMAFLALWWITSLQNRPGVWLFGLGLAAITLGLLRTLRRSEAPTGDSATP